jgi:hypothetical protein
MEIESQIIDAHPAAISACRDAIDHPTNLEIAS